VALLFGISLYTTGRIGREVSVVWVLLSARLLGSALLAAPLAARSQLAPPRSAFPFVAAAGAAEVVGILTYTLAPGTSWRSRPCWRRSSPPWPRWAPTSRSGSG
jgi:hypothetical protein